MGISVRLVTGHGGVVIVINILSQNAFVGRIREIQVRAVQLIIPGVTWL